MIKIEHIEVFGWEAAIRGMRNPMNSWDLSDSGWEFVEDPSTINPNDEILFVLGPNDRALMQKLIRAGSDHAKFLRMINVTMDITAPLYWWKEYDTYKVGTVANSCSTMHKLTAKPFELGDFSAEHLTWDATQILQTTIDVLNIYRDAYLGWDDVSGPAIDPEIKTKKDLWWQMIQLLPSSYNQRRTVQLNYQVLMNMYLARRNHKLDEWREFCDHCEHMPYFWALLSGEETME